MKNRQSQLPWIVSLVVAAIFVWLWTFSKQGESSRRTETDSNPQARAVGQSSKPDFGPIPQASSPNHQVLDRLRSQKPAVDLTSPVLTKIAGRMSRDTQGLQTITHPDGRQSVNMKGRFSTVIAAVTGADGQTQARCFTNHDELIDALSQTPAVAPTNHDKQH
jgi:hypothetical protein